MTSCHSSGKLRNPRSTHGHGSVAPLLLLQGVQLGTRLPGTDLPPRTTANTWSIAAAMRPQP